MTYKKLLNSDLQLKLIKELNSISDIFCKVESILVNSIQENIVSICQNTLHEKG